MKVTSALPLSALILIFVAAPAVVTAQISTESYLKRVDFHFHSASNKLLMLADVFPDETYGWSPDGVAMTVAEVLTHIVRYNYSIPSTWLGMDIPESIDLSEIDQM